MINARIMKIAEGVTMARQKSGGLAHQQPSRADDTDQR